MKSIWKGYGSAYDFRKFHAANTPYGGSHVDQYINALMNIQGGINPTILEERPMNVTQMDVFSRLMMERIIFFGSAFSSDVCNVITGQLLYLSSVSKDDITMYINSPGGEVRSGMQIIDTINLIGDHDNEDERVDVSTVNTAMAASMGAMLLMSGTDGKRKSLPNAEVMIHQPLGGAQGQASDIEIQAEHIKKCKRDLYNIIHDCTGQPLEKITKDADRDFWMNAQEALDYGIIDEIMVAKRRKKK